MRSTAATGGKRSHHVAHRRINVNAPSQELRVPSSSVVGGSDVQSKLPPAFRYAYSAGSLKPNSSPRKTAKRATGSSGRVITSSIWQRSLNSGISFKVVLPLL